VVSFFPTEAQQIHCAQYIFLGLYLVFIYVIMLVYHRTKMVRPVVVRTALAAQDEILMLSMHVHMTALMNGGGILFAPAPS
jgi:hypothetical protein